MNTLFDENAVGEGEKVFKYGVTTVIADTGNAFYREDIGSLCKSFLRGVTLRISSPGEIKFGYIIKHFSSLTFSPCQARN